MLEDEELGRDLLHRSGREHLRLDLLPVRAPLLGGLLQPGDVLQGPLLVARLALVVLVLPPRLLKLHLRSRGRVLAAEPAHQDLQVLAVQGLASSVVFLLHLRSDF